MSRRRTDELGAHVSAAGGVEHAPGRARQIGAAVLQLFTKTPGQWRERELCDDAVAAHRRERAQRAITFAASHDSYLINLASPDRALRRQSLQSFTAELARAQALGLDAVVTHPGNATDGDRASGISRNAEAIGRALHRTAYGGRVLIELTAGSGHALGCSFEELNQLIERVDSPFRDRVGVCIDTCHVWACGLDLVRDYDGVMARLGDVVGLQRVGMFHLNDSQRGLGSRIDRHAGIGEGELGLEPFRRLLNDPRFAHVPKVIETPKGKDTVRSDRRNLRRLRALRERSVASVSS
jgi:deoxyribonuclease-4